MSAREKLAEALFNAYQDGLRRLGQPVLVTWPGLDGDLRAVWRGVARVAIRQLSHRAERARTRTDGSP